MPESSEIPVPITAADMTIVPIDKGVAFLQVICPATSMGYCKFKVWTKPARQEDLRREWNGSEHAPTITPSINCHGGCGRHFTVINGVPS